jgi:hypothetical protein
VGHRAQIAVTGLLVSRPMSSYLCQHATAATGMRSVILVVQVGHKELLQRDRPLVLTEVDKGRQPNWPILIYAAFWKQSIKDPTDAE